jgi:hypothetical protein
MGKTSKIDISLEDYDENNIGSMLRTYNDLNEIYKELGEKIDLIKTKLRISLKEKKWDSYRDEESKISISITTQYRESINKNLLKILLNEEQMSQVVTKNSYEKMLVVTEKDRERLKNYVKK